MTTIEATPTAGLWAGWIFGIAGIFVTVLGIALLIVGLKSDEYLDFRCYFGGIALALGLLTTVITLLAMWPYKYEYHHWIPKSGTVQDINKRLVSTDGGMEEKYVVTINGQPYGITDTRATLIKKGDRLTLMCKKAYDMGSTNMGWDCKWGNLKGVGR